MGKHNGLYVSDFPRGSRVRIASYVVLERFAQEWKLHNSLKPEQLAFAGAIAVIRDVGYYHGGDELYQLQDIPGVWHEACLEAASAG